MMTHTDDTERHAAAVERVMTRVSIDLSDLAALMGVHPSTLHRRAADDAKNGTTKFPVPYTRIGQRWVIPSAPVRQFLRIGEFNPAADVKVSA